MKEYNFWRTVRGLSEKIPAHIAHFLIILNPNNPGTADRKARKHAQQLRTDRIGDPNIAEEIAQDIEARNVWVKEQANTKK